MNMDLVIVESPTKAKTISKFVGKNFTVESSYGHIRDLPKSKMGIDVEHDFAPQYMIPAKAKPIVANLKTLAARQRRSFSRLMKTAKAKRSRGTWSPRSAFEKKKEKDRTDRLP